MKARKIRGSAAAGTLVLISQLALGFQSEAQDGLASVYNLPGKTASGERLNAGGLTAAHRSLPLGSMARVTNLGTGKSIIVRINDRGPFSGGRIIDLSKRAAQAIGISGVGRVRVTSAGWVTRFRSRRR
jgi:rare lipoprotein A